MQSLGRSFEQHFVVNGYKAGSLRSLLTKQDIRLYDARC